MIALDGVEGSEASMTGAAGMRPTPDEEAVLAGRDGAVMQKVMRTVVQYGEALGAERLADISGDGHMVIAYALPGIAPSLEMLEELVAAGLTTKFPFTLDPRPPLDYENWALDGRQVAVLDGMYTDQARYEDLLLRLGLRDADAFTCRPFLEEVGNTPRRGAVLAWSESAAVVYANSVLGARTNRNGAIMDLLCNVAGKVPLSGLIEDGARRATWRIDVTTADLPLPQVLGAAIGRRVLADVPLVTGLDRFLSADLDAPTRDYLNEMGTACATAGAVGLFHVEGVTPEAVEQGRHILAPDHRECTIDEDVVADLIASYPVLWRDGGARPEKCYLGCPHVSLEQISWWACSISAALRERRQARITVPTTLCAAPQTLARLGAAGSARRDLEAAGVMLSAGCPMQLFDCDLAAGSAIITNSTKLRTYTNARFFPDQRIVEIVVGGEI
jgi:predicted aconitase